MLRFRSDTVILTGHTDTVSRGIFLVLVYDLVWTIGIPIALVVLTCTIMERAELYKMYIRYLIPREYSEHGSVHCTIVDCYERTSDGMGSLIRPYSRAL
jgi:hypothetical protein